MPAADRRLFSNPWWIVFGATMSMLVAQAPVTLFTFGLFIKPLGAEFGWDRAQLSAANSVGAVFSGLAIPVIGIMMDRWGVKRVLIPVILLFAASVGAFALTPASIAVFTVLMAATGLFGSGQGPLGYVKCISGWFDDKRGLALGIAVAGIGLGATLVPQYTQYLIGEFGWRYAYVGLAALLLVIALPSVILLIREPAEGVTGSSHHVDLDSLTPVDILPGLDIKEALTSAKFWMLGAAVLLVSTVVNGMVVHIVPLLTDHGYSPAAAAALLAAVGLSTMVGRLLGRVPRGLHLCTLCCRVLLRAAVRRHVPARKCDRSRDRHHLTRAGVRNRSRHDWLYDFALFRAETLRSDLRLPICGFRSRRGTGTVHSRLHLREAPFIRAGADRVWRLPHRGKHSRVVPGALPISDTQADTKDQAGTGDQSRTADRLIKLGHENAGRRRRSEGGAMCT